ncbi:MAG: response regulator, partial [Cyanothece sp. SIO1E1]|nr:response regulator [Cyanothece sp. SIO1E1]
MSPNQAKSSPGNILLVDDTPDNLRFLSTVLSEKGYKVRSVINGQMALRAVQAAPPDLILLDIKMPQMNGYEVCQQLKADTQTAEIPVIFVSALNDVSDKIKAFNAGGVDYITKPFQCEEVLARTANQLALLQLKRRLQTQNAQLQQEIGERKQVEAALQSAKTELEQKVEERTAALKASNAQLTAEVAERKQAENSL